MQAVALGWLIQYFDESDSAAWEGWVYAIVVVLSGFGFR